MDLDFIEITADNLTDYLGLDIVAFHWASAGACGEGGGIVFITSDGNVYHTNYLHHHYGVTAEEIYRLFPQLASFQPGIFGGGQYPKEWKSVYMGLGNFLVVHESIWDAFIQLETDESKKQNTSLSPGFFYFSWIELILKVLKTNKSN